MAGLESLLGPEWRLISFTETRVSWISTCAPIRTISLSPAASYALVESRRLMELHSVWVEDGRLWAQLYNGVKVDMMSAAFIASHDLREELLAQYPNPSPLDEILLLQLQFRTAMLCDVLIRKLQYLSRGKSTR